MISCFGPGNKISLAGPDQAGSNRSVSKSTNNRISSNMEQIKLFVDLNYLILERINKITSGENGWKFQLGWIIPTWLGNSNLELLVSSHSVRVPS